MKHPNIDNLVSIITAAYNAERTIKDTIDSVLAQSYENWEMIIIDDDSSDRTADIVDGYAKLDSRIRYYKNESNLGVALSRNRGFNLARGSWIAILDSDDIWDSNKLSKQISYARLHNCEFLFSASSFMDDSGDKKDWILNVPSKVDYKLLLKQGIISNSSVLIKKYLIIENEVIGNNIHEDYACWLKVLKNGIIAHGINEPLITYRLTKGAKTSNKLASAKMNWNTYRYIGLNPFVAFYYMCWYTIKGFKKYKNLW